VDEQVVQFLLSILFLVSRVRPIVEDVFNFTIGKVLCQSLFCLDALTPKYLNDWPFPPGVLTDSEKHGNPCVKGLITSDFVAHLGKFTHTKLFE
jgi:hypothetical protein